MKNISVTIRLVILALLLLSHNFIKAQTDIIPFIFNNKIPTNIAKNANSNNGNTLGKKVIKQRLDSADTDRYDSSLNTWITTNRNTFQYDNKGNCVSMTYISLDKTLQLLRNERKYIYDFDGNGNQILNEYYNWDETNKAWILSYREEYLFDHENNKLSQIDYNYNPNTNKAEPTNKTNYIFTNNKLDYSIDSNYDQVVKKWSVINKTNYTLNPNGNIISEIIIWWDKVTNKWTNSGKILYSYDANNNITSTINYSWNGGINDWIPIDKIENVYNKDANITSKIESYWNTTDNVWVNSSKDSSVYNNGDLSKKIAYRWNTSLNKWEIEFEAMYSYNINYSKSDLLAPLSIIKSNNHMLSGALSQRFENGVLRYNERGVLYYSTINFNGTNKLDALPIKIYPNPTNDLLNIDFNVNINLLSLTLTDISGKINKDLKYENTSNLLLDISDLSKGIYFLNLRTNNSNTVYKIIKND